MGVGADSDAGGPGADLHHNVDSRTEGEGNGHSSQGGCKMWPEQGCFGMKGNISPRRTHGTLGSRNAVVSASDVPTALHGVQVSHMSLTELLFLFSWGAASLLAVSLLPLVLSDRAACVPEHLL